MAYITKEDVKNTWRKNKKYHVVIPYFYHFYVDAETEEEAIQIAHDSEGSMGEYDEKNIFVEETN